MIMLMGKKPPPGDKPADDGEEPKMSDEGLHAAMEDFLAGVKEEDTAKMAEAFQHAMDLCDSGEGSSDGKSEEY